MSVVDFFDANVILYALDAAAPEPKRLLSEKLVHSALAEQSAVISWQIVQETLHVVSNRFKSGIRGVDRQSLLDGILVPLWRVQPSSAIYARSIALQERYRFAFYDCLVVASALDAGCKRLLTEDLQHGQRIDGLRIENPFKA